MLTEIGAERVRGTHDVTVMTVALGAAMGLTDNSLAAAPASSTATPKRMHIVILGILEDMSVTCLFACTKTKESILQTIQKCFSCKI